MSWIRHVIVTIVVLQELHVSARQLQHVSAAFKSLLGKSINTLRAASPPRCQVYPMDIIYTQRY